MSWFRSCRLRRPICRDGDASEGAKEAASGRICEGLGGRACVGIVGSVRLVGTPWSEGRSDSAHVGKRREENETREGIIIEITLC